VIDPSRTLDQIARDMKVMRRQSVRDARRRLNPQDVDVASTRSSFATTIRRAGH
jgi:hypothetical protein